MKIERYLNLLAVMSVFAACQNETDILDAPLKGTEVTIEAAREGIAGSRTTLTEEYKINWHESDKLSVFLGSNVNQPFTIHEGAGTDYATFKGTGDIFITGGSESSAGAVANVAYYPYSEGVQVSQGTNGAYMITASLPSNQTYRQGSFGQDAYHMVAVAESNRDYAFTFKNVGSMFMLYLKGTAEITKIELESLANKLAGASTITAAYGEEPSVILDANSAESKITLNCMTEVEGGVTKGVQLSDAESTVFVISVPPIAGDAEDLTFTIYDANYGYMVYKNAAAYSVARNQYYTFGATTAVEYQAAGYDLADDVVAWIGNNTFTSISSAVEASQANDVISVKPGTYTEVVNVKGGKNVTIQPANNGDEVTIAGVDHTSNANHSTVIFNNLTIDNSLQTEGWYTGTSQNMKPCVGAWGGNLTFNNCKFIVSGESKAETGVMTWWTGENDMTLKFDECTFDGKNNHASARAMQIYGHVDLAIEDCTFNTSYRYSLKYVGEEGHTATFDNNKIYNATNFVELGTTVTEYQGQDCIVKFTGSILNTGIGNYLVANDEGQTIYIDGLLVVSTDTQLLSALTDATASEIKILLGADLNLPQDKDVTAANVIIDGNNHSIQITSHYRNLFADFTDSNAKLVLKNLTVKGAKTKTTDGSAISTTWDLYDVRFNCDVEMTDVNFDQCVCIANGADAVLNNVNITENTKSGLYAMWIEAKGSTVTINGGKIDNANGRGIKIDEQYVESTGGTIEKTILNVTSTEFITNAKAAIMVKSKAGADITLDNVNIENVAADKVNAVWCDEDAAAYNDLITVTGGSKKVEGQ